MSAALCAGLRPVDSIEVRMLVDNVTDSLSSVLRGVANENEVLRRYGMKVMSGAAKCCAHHGLALLVEARTGDQVRTLLFDAGPDPQVLLRNAPRLGVAFGEIGAVAMSHGHWDHGGALLEAIRAIHAANGGRPVPCHLNDGMLVARGNTQPDGSVLPYENLPGVDELRAAGAEVVSDPQARRLLDDCFYLSGEIPRVTGYEKGYPGHLKLGADGKTWEPDPWLMDERFLAVHVRGKGAVVFTACSHAGVVNVLTEARKAFGEVPLHAVMGGFHLAGPKVEPVIDETVGDLARFGLARIVAAHCTGWRALNRLARTFGEDVVVPGAVGRCFTF